MLHVSVIIRLLYKNKQVNIKNKNIKMGACIDGPKFGKYTLIKRIGKGAEATVFQVQCYGQSFAMKYFYQDCDFLLIKKHIQELNALNQRYIVKIIKHFPHKNRYCMIMEKCVNSLDNIFDELSEAQKKQYTLQIVKAVQHLHQHKLFHSDLKPQNILINNKNRIKLTDFTKCRRLNTLSKKKTVNGTENYWSPQQHRGQSHTFKADCWALGLILFEIQIKKRVDKIRPRYKCPGKLPDFPNQKDLQQINDNIMRNVIQILLKQDPDKRATATQVKQMLQLETKKNRALIAADSYDKIVKCLQQIQIKTTHLTIKHLGQSELNPSLQKISSLIQKLCFLRYLKIQINHTIDYAKNFIILVNALKKLTLLQTVQIISPHLQNLQQNHFDEIKQKIKFIDKQNKQNMK